MKAIKWTIIFLYVAIPMIYFTAMCPPINLKWYIFFVSFGSFIFIQLIRQAILFSKWFDSKLK